MTKVKILRHPHCPPSRKVLLLLGCDPHGLHHACFLCATDPDVSEWCPYTTPWFRQTYYDGPPTSQEGSDHDTELDLGNDQEETDAEERVWDWIDKFISTCCGHGAVHVDSVG
ncbi:hypothetical protein TREMEDRAFT_60400 [Tremella mesenterica DSM 1558]|uniref:uncharacterized protein n=1 Tax=Tremella mesenterica (strain ATCC 24925 / CBS 8224 / DSM 1558 / NBRC 9311 / NRRL Y-6157 / RJB 2259-6 / UBC 559-6) TaxID=578456 RepID=UPI0003F4A37B|nr:uncharacterized protein TREMEDRAFT_60400 [Tremella mesenterica DSM 1558]EIW71473.1 hypothetical protein TREMEDRAFT_60400 [Tremella mesenterica DSM 1558]